MFTNLQLSRFIKNCMHKYTYIYSNSYCIKITKAITLPIPRNKETANPMYFKLERTVFVSFNRKDLNPN